MKTLEASGITSEKAANEDELTESTKEEEKEDGNADNDDDYELPKEKTEEELAEEARTEPNTAEIQHLMWLSELEIIRAKSIYARLSTEGTYENDPVGSGPLTDLAPGIGG